MSEIVIINYGSGNVRSVMLAIERLGASAVLSHDPEEIKKAAKVIFPGVGEAGSALASLKASGLDQLLPDLQQPVLGICLGMQMMCDATEEGDTPGLGIFPVKVAKFKPFRKVPHMGWNTAENPTGPLFKGCSAAPYYYFVHSYFVPVCEDTAAITDYIHPFSSALHKDNFYGVQFHPEKSGDAGAHILQNFLDL